MRLILEYTTSNTIESWDHVIPFEYESAEQMLIDLELEVQKYLKAAQERDAMWAEFGEKWLHRLPSKSESEAKIWLEEYNTLNRKFTSGEYINIKFKKYVLYVHHFVEDGKFLAPNIFTVDEWFEYHKVNG